MGSETLGIEVRGCVIVGGKVGGVDGTTIGDEVVSVDGTPLGSSTGDGREMEPLYWPNISQRPVIALNWALQVGAGAYVIAHVWVYMVWMMRSYGVTEGCAR